MSTFRGHIKCVDIMNTEIIHIALENLKKTTKIDGRWDKATDVHLDGQVVFNINNTTIRFNAEIKKELRNHQLFQLEKTAKQFPPFIIIAERIFPKIKEHLREQNMAYLEANGNIFFNQKGVHYFIDTQKPVQTEKETGNRAFTKTGLRVLFHFLLDKNLVNLPHREIAKITNVAHGNIAYILNGLKENGFLLKLKQNEFILNNKKELLEKWMDAYKEDLQPALKIGQFRFADKNRFTSWKELKLNEKTTWWGGEPAADIITNYLRPGELTIYTTKSRNELIREFKLIPDNNGNIIIYNAFWDIQQWNYKNTVHPLLVYTDLMNTGNSRCQETAQLIWDKGLANEF